ncbi:MAG: MltA domain-containing protein [Pacificimonas sp.]|jgi:membrane-bound lytic murein transglycosylase A|nr:MltA domain-containing protein [Pacificimonas sp.]
MPSRLPARIALLAPLLLAACMTPERPPLPGTPADTAAPETPTEPVLPESAAELGARVVSFAGLPGWQGAHVEGALTAFRKSCFAVQRRTDRTGIVTPEDWAAPCAAAADLPDDPATARRFFETAFLPVAIGDTEAFVTGYYEPEIEGCREPRPGCNVPIHGMPSDLVRVEQPDPDNPGETITPLGRIDDNGDYQLYWDRAAIAAGALKGRNLEIAYAKDYIELFFLQIQGSGRVRMDDGSVMRIGYAGQNGREYVGIGRRLAEMDALAPGEASMQGIMRWLRANPDDGRALMFENKSYIFFRELTGEGPLGAMNVAVTPEVSLAADPRFTPLGAPVFLTTRYLDEDRIYKPLSRLMVAQDTGGAIKGANRFDFFWGPGQRARTIAGGMAEDGEAYILLPRAAAQRLQAEALIASL